MIRQINQYFTDEPEVVLLPRLEWDYDSRPNFNEEGELANSMTYRICSEVKKANFSKKISGTKILLFFAKY